MKINWWEHPKYIHHACNVCNKGWGECDCKYPVPHKHKFVTCYEHKLAGFLDNCKLCDNRFLCASSRNDIEMSI